MFLKKSFVNSITKDNRNNNSTHFFKELELENEKELELLHIVFRHGERSPADTYPNDPYINHTFEPYGWGQITNQGKFKLYETGQWLRKRYNKFLGSQYYPDLVHAQATEVTRTQTSMNILLSGLFPHEHQKIAVYSQPLNGDTLLLVRLECPRYYEALEEVLSKPEITRKLSEYEKMLQELTKITGMEIRTAEDVSSLWSTLRAEEAFGLELPEWTKKYYPKKMQELTDLSYIWNIYTPELKRIKGGPFLTKMSSEWKNRKDNSLELNKRKLFIYCGHDSTIVNILGALDLWKQQFPEYGIMVIFELYKNKKTNDYEVRILQKNESEEPISLRLLGHGEFIPLNIILSHIEPMMTSPTLCKECTPVNPNFKVPQISGP